MKKGLRIIIVLIFSALFVYTLIPSPQFPEPMSGFFQSGEPGDVETPLRRGYYTNATRQEVMDHYMNEFKGYSLNYPPEEAETIIRDQTKSTFLEEIVHPLRESVYINGFEPNTPEYAIVINGTAWRQKITIKYIPSRVYVRSFIVLLTGMVSLLLLEVWMKKHD
jgi:hypothetical protein